MREGGIMVKDDGRFRIQRGRGKGRGDAQSRRI